MYTLLTSDGQVIQRYQRLLDPLQTGVQLRHPPADLLAQGDRGRVCIPYMRGRGK